MNFSISDLNNFNTLFVGTKQDAEINNMGGNLFFGDPSSYSPKVLDYVMKRFSIRSVLDVGAGLGDVSSYIHNTYHVPVIGMEGLDFNVANARYPLCQHDLTTGPFKCGPVDLCVSVEVAEHIDPKYVDNYIDTLVHGKYILMTHALPGENGDFHVNEQPSEYWVEKLKERGYGLLTLDTIVLRKLAASEEHVQTYYAKSGLLFGRLPVKLESEMAKQKAALIELHLE